MKQEQPTPAQTTPEPPTPAQPPVLWQDRLLDALVGRHWRRLEQVASVMVWISLALPFITVKGCDAKAVPRTYVGWEALLHAPALLVPIYVIAGLLLVWKTRPKHRSRLERAARLSWKAAFTGLAAVLVWLGPFLSFLFSSVRAEVGQWVAFIPWVPLWSGAMLGAGAILILERHGGSSHMDEPTCVRHGRQVHLWGVSVLLGLPLLAPLHPDIGWRDMAEGATWLSPVLLALLVGLGLGARALQRHETWPLVSGGTVSLLLCVLTGFWAGNVMDPWDWAFLPLGACSGISFLLSLRVYLAWRVAREG